MASARLEYLHYLPPTAHFPSTLNSYLDEAHCLSKWGHDFRPDYRYVGRFIGEKAGDEPVSPILCLTATAKPDVKDELVEYFHDELDIDLKVFDGGARRTNLDFVVVPTRSLAKFDDLHQILNADLPTDAPGAGSGWVW